MALKSLLAGAGIVLASSLVACMAAPEESVDDGEGAVSQAEFNRNNLVADSALRDSDALAEADIQAFLENTPWGKRSVLADYTEEGKTAAEIIYASSAKHGINPLELLVRAQMEQGLISKTTASDESISIAFGCGCPHSPVCSDKYEGFANQADCAAGTLSRSMDRATTSEGTVSGWKKGTAKRTEDGLSVTPSNAATAALYTYTPWIGEAGGGRKGVGGASLHAQTWDRFADAIGYGVASTSNVNTPQGSAADAGAEDPEPTTAADAGAGTDAGDDGDDTEPTPPPSADAGAPSEEADAGAPSEEEPSAGGEREESDPSDGEDDAELLAEGNAPPTTNAPPPRGSSRQRSRGGSSAISGDEDEATDADLATKRRAAAGCSASGGTAGAGNAALVGIAIALATASKRRRQKA